MISSTALFIARVKSRLDPFFLSTISEKATLGNISNNIKI